MGFTTRVRLHNLQIPWEGSEPSSERVRRAAGHRLGIHDEDMLQSLQIIRRALDVRRQVPRYSFSIDIDLPEALAGRLLRSGKVQAATATLLPRWVCRQPLTGAPPVVVGAGPAGLFAALTLAEAGLPPLLLERGKAVEPRARDVSLLYARGLLSADSNVCYGEGGAGTFSDGKLYTRVGDPRVEHIMRILVSLGADPDILIDNRPHLGTDRLVRLLIAMRARLLALGTNIRFSTAISDVCLQDGRLVGLRLRDGELVSCAQAILATGHSARDVWERLLAWGLPLESRPFAVGFRVEHPQDLIDTLRYGRAAALKLPAADYRLTYNEGTPAHHRGVYSFCMCPGGVVVTTPTDAGELCINGMSHASRRGRFANSALVVSVGPADFAAAGWTGVFAGVQFQQAAERAAYSAGSGSFVAPASRVRDFMANKVSQDLGNSSYRRGLMPADLTELYPKPIIGALQRALVQFDQALPGFASSEATLIGVETRTAAPVRVPRDATLQAVGAQGLYPAGEGMGYGGGIISAAVDGMRAAEALLQGVGASCETMPA